MLKDICQISKSDDRTIMGMGSILGLLALNRSKSHFGGNTKAFADTANEEWQRVVDESNRVETKQRVYFADALFTSRNAIFAPQSLLWGLGPDFPFICKNI